MLSAITISWGLSLFILIISAHLSHWMGEKGVIAIERLMGFVMVMISIQMFLTGLKTFMKS
jgi:multiple antibiotic resistance protein